MNKLEKTSDAFLFYLRWMLCSGVLLSVIRVAVGFALPQSDCCSDTPTQPAYTHSHAQQKRQRERERERERERHTHTHTHTQTQTDKHTHAKHIHTHTHTHTHTSTHAVAVKIPGNGVARKLVKTEVILTIKRVL